LTLAFLEECNQQQKVAIQGAMDATSFDPFELRIEGVGCFKRSNPRSGDVWWAGVRKNESLLQLQADLVRQLRDAGFELERRKYKPHVTLGRQIIMNERFAHGGLLGVSILQRIHCFELMQSERIADRLTYTSLHRVQAREIFV